MSIKYAWARFRAFMQDRYPGMFRNGDPKDWELWNLHPGNGNKVEMPCRRDWLDFIVKLREKSS
eukprot:93860-Chlamydomonas_euryale.AAC.1